MERSTITAWVGCQGPKPGRISMGLMSRTSAIVRAWYSKLLDRAEDPAVTLDYSYERQLELLQNVKKGIADVVTAKKRLELQTKKLETELPKLHEQARQAPADNRADTETAPPGSCCQPRGSRTRRARAQGVRAAATPEPRPADRRPGCPAGEAHRQRE